MQSLQQTYPEAWRQFWKLRILHWISLASWLPAIITEVSFAIKITSPLGILLALLPTVFVCYTYSELSAFSCPRCRKPYFWGPAAWPIFLQGACRNCALSKYADDQV
jgi:hypothetical protein